MTFMTWDSFPFFSHGWRLIGDMRIWRKRGEREHEREKRETKIMQYVVHTLQILELASCAFANLYYVNTFIF